MRRQARTLVACGVASVLALCAGAALAKLPPLSDEAKAKAAEAAAKTAWGDKVAAYQLCQSQDRVAAQYRSSAKASAAAGSAPSAALAPCADPGPFAAPVPAAALESAGAHSPPATAAAPPSGSTPLAEAGVAPKAI